MHSALGDRFQTEKTFLILVKRFIQFFTVAPQNFVPESPPMQHRLTKSTPPSSIPWFTRAFSLLIQTFQRQYSEDEILDALSTSDPSVDTGRKLQHTLFILPMQNKVVQANGLFDDWCIFFRHWDKVRRVFMATSKRVCGGHVIPPSSCTLSTRFV